MSDSTKDILVVGGNFRNKGAAAMVQTAVDQLPEYDVTIASIFDEDVDQSEYDVIKHHRLLELVLKEGFHTVTGGILSPRRLLSRWSNRGSEAKEFLHQLRKADAVIDLSGYALTDKFGTFRIWSWIEVLLLSKLLRTPFLMLPQSVGPLATRRNRLLVKAFLRFADVRIVRGSVSKKWLDSIGVQDVRVYPDTAFLFEPAADAEVDAILQDIGLADEPFVTIVPNARLYERWPEYEQVLCRIVSTIHDASQCEVLLLPHEYTGDSDDMDDRYVIEQLQKHVEFEDAIVVDAEYSARELKGILGRSELLVGSRLHSTVAGISSRVPTIALGWSNKYYEIHEWLDQEKYVWTPDTYDEQEVRSQVESVLADESDWQFTSLEQVKRKARNSFEEHLS